MGKHSAIGPIDPQITFPTQHGLFAAPAQCLLDDIERAKKEVAGNPVLAALWATKIKDYPPGILQICDNTIKLSKQKVAEWLQTYMFRGDNSAGKKATDIAEWLGTANHHLTHGRPIGIEAAHKVGLKVTPLENDQVLQERVLSVFHATAVTFEVSNVVKIIENQRGKGFYVSIAEGKSGS